MKNRLIGLCIPVLFIIIGAGCVSTPSFNPEDNLLKNGGFDIDDPQATVNIEGVMGTANWFFILDGGTAGGEAACSSEDGVIHVGDYVDEGLATYAIQLIQNPVVVEHGYEYYVQFDAKAAAPRDIEVKVGGIEDRSWQDYTEGMGVGTIVTLDTTMKTHRFTFIMNADTDENARFEFQLGLSMIDVWIDNVWLVKGRKL